VERVDPVLPFMLASWLSMARRHGGEPDSYRYADRISLLYLAFVATIVGYGMGALLGRYETWRVAPLSLLVPVVGWPAPLLLGETLNGLQLLGAVLIMAGLYINVFGLRVWRTGAVPR
jgi:O-acetylserine/cysteine efflux transporter